MYYFVVNDRQQITVVSERIAKALINIVQPISKKVPRIHRRLKVLNLCRTNYVQFSFSIFMILSELVLPDSQ